MATPQINNPPTEPNWELISRVAQHLIDYVLGPAAELEIPGASGTRPSLATLEALVSAIRDGEFLSDVKNVRDDAQAQVILAEAQAALAENYLSLTQSLADIYESIADGLAATANGEYFRVRSGMGDDTYAQDYENVAGTAEPRGNPYPAATDGLRAASASLDRRPSSGLMSFRDTLGRPFIHIDAFGGVHLPGLNLSVQGSIASLQALMSKSDAPLLIQLSDPVGRRVFAFDLFGHLHLPELDRSVQSEITALKASAGRQTKEQAARYADIAAASLQTPKNEQCVIFSGSSNDDGDIPQSNVKSPTMIRLNETEYFAVTEGQYGGSDQSITDLVGRKITVTDDDITLGSVQTIVAHDDDNPAYQNPLLVRVRTGPNAGRVYLYFNSYFWDMPADGIAFRPCRVYSDDDCATWSAIEDFTAEIPYADNGGALCGPGIGIQLMSGEYAGRMIVPCYTVPYNNTSSERRLFCIYSDDGLDTQQFGTLCPSQSGESQAAEQADGSLLFIVRNLSDYKQKAFSYDGGVTITETEPTLQDDGSQSFTTHAVKSGLLGMQYGALHPAVPKYLVSSPGSFGERFDMTLSLLYQDFTVAASAIITPGIVGYSTVSERSSSEFIVVSDVGAPNADGVPVKRKKIVLNRVNLRFILEN